MPKMFSPDRQVFSPVSEITVAEAKLARFGAINSVFYILSFTKYLNSLNAFKIFEIYL